MISKLNVCIQTVERMYFKLNFTRTSCSDILHLSNIKKKIDVMYISSFSSVLINLLLEKIWREN